MPKDRLPAGIWTARLKAYAIGKYSFGRGEKPSITSPWYKVMISIERCPRFRCVTDKDLFGNIIVCTCNYHKVCII